MIKLEIYDNGFGIHITGFISLWCANAKGDDIGLMGYRTRRSEFNEKNWKAGNLLCGFLLLIEGISLFILDLTHYG